MPLQASTTSSFFVVAEPSGISSMMLPSRNTGMSNCRIAHTAQREAKSWSGNATLLKMIVGMGIASASSMSGTATARSIRNPQK
jgi:hypothetical protein